MPIRRVYTTGTGVEKYGTVTHHSRSVDRRHVDSRKSDMINNLKNIVVFLPLSVRREVKGLSELLLLCLLFLLLQHFSEITILGMISNLIMSSLLFSLNS